MQLLAFLVQRWLWPLINLVFWRLTVYLLLSVITVMPWVLHFYPTQAISLRPDHGERTGINSVMWEISGIYGSLVASLSNTPFSDPDWFTIPKGYRIEPFAYQLEEPRRLTLSPSGNIVVSQPYSNQVSILYVYAPSTQHGVVKHTLISELKQPEGLVFYDDQLFVSHAEGIQVYGYDAAKEKIIGQGKSILKFPSSQGTQLHPLWQDEGWLYTSIPQACQGCDASHPWRGNLIRLSTDGSVVQVVAKGLWQVTDIQKIGSKRALHTLNLSRSGLGAFFPRDELNQLTIGSHFGAPHFHEHNQPDPSFLHQRLPKAHEFYQVPYVLFPADANPQSLSETLRSVYFPLHGAQNLISFYGSNKNLQNDLFSVNTIDFQTGASPSIKPFISGFYSQGKVNGRPVDTLLAHRSIYISDEHAGVIWKVTYTP